MKKVGSITFTYLFTLKAKSMRTKTFTLSSLWMFCLVFWAYQTSVGQVPPPNDKCIDAIELTIYETEEEAIRVSGDTRNSTDGALSGIPVCSANWYRDDVWFKITTPDEVNDGGYSIRVYFGEEPDDINDVGIALYNSCDPVPGNTPFFCANNPANGTAIACLQPNQTIYIRVWSAAGDPPNWEAGWGTFRIAAFERNEKEDGLTNVLWGDDPGEGDFAGGINDWTTIGISCTGGAPAENAQWVWDPIGSALSGAYAGGQRLTSRTVCNGAMVFNSDFMDNNGVPGPPFGTGPCPSPQEGALLSPLIDLSVFNVNSVSVEFHQNLRQFSSSYFVGYSTDGGTVWTDIQINEAVPLNSGHINEVLRIPLPGAAGSPNLQLRFRIEGDYYYWVIDDVRIVEQECNNLRANPFFSMAPYGGWHVDQLSDFALIIDIENMGSCPQHNVKVDFEVRNEDGDVLYAQSNDYGTLQPNQLNENTLFEICAELPAGTPPGRYFGSYTVYSDSIDFNPADNVQRFEFLVHESVMSMDIPGGTYSGIRPGGTPTKYTMANYYYIPRGSGYRICEAEVGISNAVGMADIGGDVLVYLFEWDDLNNDGNMQFTEANRIAFNQYFFEPGDPNNSIYTIELLDENDPNFEPCVDLKDDQGYVLAVEYIPPFGFPNEYLFVLSQSGAVANFRATWFAHNPTGAGGLGANCNVKHRGLGVATNDADMIQFFGSFNSGATPVIRMVLDKISTTDPVVESTNVNFRLWPNPVSDLLRIEFDNPRYQDRVILRITDLQGRVVAEEQAIDTMQGVWVRDVSGLGNGIYFLSLISNAGVQTERFIVQH